VLNNNNKLESRSIAIGGIFTEAYPDTVFIGDSSLLDFDAGVYSDDAMFSEGQLEGSGDDFTPAYEYKNIKDLEKNVKKIEDSNDGYGEARNSKLGIGSFKRALVNEKLPQSVFKQLEDILGKGNVIKINSEDGKNVNATIRKETIKIYEEITKAPTKTLEERRAEAIKGMNSKDKKIREDSAKVIKQLTAEEIEAKSGIMTTSKITEMEETLADNVKRGQDVAENSIVPDYTQEKGTAVELKKKLSDLLDRGKDENYFVELSHEKYIEFLDGKTPNDESLVIDDFIEEKFRTADFKRMEESGDVVLQMRVFPALSAVDKAVGLLNTVWQKVIGDNAWNGLLHVISKLSRVKFEAKTIKGEMTMLYPFEYITGLEKAKVTYPMKQFLAGKKAEIQEDLYYLAKDLEKFTKEERNKIIENIENGKYDNRVNDKLEQTAFEIEERFYTAGWNLVKAGIMPEDVFKEWAGKYFPRMYNATEKRIKGIASKNGTKMDQRYLKSRKDGYQVHYRQKGKLIKSKYETKEQRDAFAADLERQGIKYKLVNPLSDEYIRETLGGRKDLIYTVQSGLMNEIYDYEKAKEFSRLAKVESFARAEQDVENGFVKQIPDNKLYGDLAGMYVHQWYVSDVLTSVLQPQTMAASIFKKVSSLLKSFKTIYDPGTVSMNAVSNTLLADMAGVPLTRVDYWARNVWNSLPALMDPMKGKGAYAELRKLGVTGKTMMLEIDEGAGLDIEAERLKDIIVLNKKGTAMDFPATMWNITKKFHLKVGEAYSLSEDIAKAVVYDWHKNELGKSTQDAAKEAQIAIFDYGQVSDFVGLLRQGFLGPAFVTFAAKIMPRLAETMVRKPFTILKYKLIWSLLTTATLTAVSGSKISNREGVETITADDINKLKENLTGDWYLPINVKYSDKGYVQDIVVMDFSRALPWGQITKPGTGLDDVSDFTLTPKLGSFNTTAESESGILDPFTPGGMIIPVISALTTNNDPFTGKEIYNKRDSDLENGKAIYNYIHKTLGPGVLPSPLGEGAGGYLYEKLYKAFVDSDLSGYSYKGEKVDKGEALLRLSGLKVSHINVEDQMMFAGIRMKEDIDDLRKQIKNKNVQLNNTLSKIDSAEKRKEIIENTNKDIEVLNEKLKNVTAEKEELTDWFNNFMKRTKIK